MKTKIITLLDEMGENPYDIIIIDNTDGTTTSMLKSTYDAIQAEQSTPSVIDEVKTK
jgi:hypothetical protein